MTQITSTQNPGIKELLKLEKAGARKESGLFVVEGYREIRKAVDSGFVLKTLYHCPAIQDERLKQFVRDLAAVEKTEVSAHVFSRIAYRDNRDGLLATAEMRFTGLEELPQVTDPLYLVLETVEKPGNLGAILRTADGAGVDAVIVCDNQTDLYNPNVIRASLGCVFTTRVIVTSSEEAVAFFRGRGVRIYSAALQDSEDYLGVSFREGCAIVLGSEAGGLSSIWRDHAERVIRIPMKGAADSLNVSVSAAVLVFEALRQRRSPGNF